MSANLILSGGVAHDFAATSGALTDLLAESGVHSTTTEDLALREPPGTPLVTVNALRWRMDAERFAPQRPRWRFTVPPHTREALTRHLAGGGAILAMHTATICFDDWPEWGDLLGASWNWNRSWHPPLGPTEVTVHGHHPVTTGVPDFTVTDEVYSDLDIRPDVTPLAEANGRPLLWAREIGGGRIVHDALGHDTRSYASPAHRALLANAVRWLLDRR